MKRRLMKYAMLYLSDLAEGAFPNDDSITVEKFIEIMEFKFDYREINDGSRVDAVLTITEHGSIEAVFRATIAR